MGARMNRMLNRGTFYRDRTCVNDGDGGGVVGGDGGGGGGSGGGGGVGVGSGGDGSGCGFSMMKRAMRRDGGREEG